jgi:hypothetical protein
MQIEPALGTLAVLPDQRVATLTAIAPYTRRDGAASSVLTWTMLCTTCKAPYTVTTGREGPASRNLKIKNCPAHRANWAEIVERNRKIGEANRKRKATVKASKAAVREAQKAARQAAMAEQAFAKAARANPLGHPKRKLSDEDVAEIRKLSAEGFSSGELAMVFPVSSSAIRNILGGRRRA